MVQGSVVALISACMSATLNDLTVLLQLSLFKSNELIHQIQNLLQNCFAFGLEIHAILFHPLRSQFLAFVLRLQFRILFVLFLMCI